MSPQNKEKQSLSPMRQTLLNSLNAVEKGLLFCHIVVLYCVVFIHIFLPTKLFLGFVGLHNALLRDYWYFSKNMTEEGGIYGPMFSVLGQDILWVLQIYIPALLPFVLISFLIRRTKGGLTLIDSLGSFLFNSVISIIGAVIAGGILGTLMVAVSYVFAFGCTSPEISGEIGKVLDFPAGGIVIFDLLLGTIMIGLSLNIKPKHHQRWMWGGMASAILLLIALNQLMEIEVRVETDKEGEEVTAYAHHWYDAVYKKEAVVSVKELIVERSQGQILPHKDMVDTLACKAGGVDCGTYTWPGTSIHFVPADEHLYEEMYAFFHDRPADVGIYGSVIEVVYPLKKGRSLKTQSTRVEINRNRLKGPIQYADRNGTYLEVSPVSSATDWGIQILCSGPEANSILAIVTQRGLAFYESEGVSPPEFLYLYETDAIDRLMAIDDGHTSLYVNGAPLLRVETCDLTHYEPTAIGVDGESLSVNTVRKTIDY